MAFRTIVISRNPDHEKDKTTIENAFADRAVNAGYRVITLPHIYYLSSDDAPAKTIAAINEPLVIASWLHPRPTEWIVRTLGCAGDLYCVNIGAYPDADACFDAIKQNLTTGLSGGTIKKISFKTKPRWNPVIDYSRCIACGQCLDFCLFGVYRRTDDGKILVANPTHCKAGCPACARVCPAGAIMFPHYESDDGIAGAPGAVIAGAKSNAKALKARIKKAVDGGEPEATVVSEGRGPKKKTSKPSAPKSKTKSKPQTDDIDDLIDALDELDV